MSASTVNTTAEKPKATRQAFGEMLAQLGESNPKIVVLDADLSKSTKSELFAKKFKERFFEIGIAEANLIGTGAGLAMSGYVPFICSFGCFVTGRFDQIRMSVSYADANVKIVGTHAGVGIGDDGHSQMGLEDLSLMRGLPGMTVLQPCDELETRQMVEFAAKHHGPVYLRLTRQNLAPVHGPAYQFVAGKIDVLSHGNSQTALIASGATVQECVQAQQALLKRGLSVAVVNVPTLKPFDSKGIAQLAARYSTMVTVEDHYTIGGLGSAVAETLAELSQNTPRRLIRLGVNDQFGESGEGFELYEKFGISAAQIEKAVRAL
jgi:transketolase